ncbi:hypothetical protein MKQ68_02815 [Chitinophaga horti]|uniref:Lipocalin-like domain-containing protein n=1 Tax=Chitinophaga horti TaxID=2920382 RepID=A0ABY6J3R4_9BACT|nr:hypothetical protein [Chitinophaga horti]UYQ94021.1 hypothetical protein MKQ68_02815 [Chitinophaga horti]
MNKLKLAMPLALALFAFACDKEKDAKPKTTEEKLIGKWSYHSITSDKPFIWEDGGTATTDGMANMAACIKDNYLELKADNVMQENEGPTKCDPDDDQIYAGEWSLDGTEIVIDEEVYKLISVDGSTLKVSTTGEVEDVGEVTVTLTLKRR